MSPGALARWAGALTLCVVMHPASAEICYSDAQAFNASTAPTNDTAFNCPGAGRATLPQLAQAGWTIVRLSPLVVTDGQGGSQISQQLVLRQSIDVYADGFESS